MTSEITRLMKKNPDGPLGFDSTDFFEEIVETAEVLGRRRTVKRGKNRISIQPKARIVRKGGNLFTIKGGTGYLIEQPDIEKILNEQQSEELKKSLRRTNK